jgi:hypothetical protein
VPAAKQTQGTQDTWNIVDFYRNARGIYETGPKGEGQKLWKSYKTAQKLMKERTAGIEIIASKEEPIE